MRTIEDQAKINHLIRLVREARGFRRCLEEVNYTARISRVYHRAYRREQRRVRLLGTTAAEIDGRE